MGLLNNKVCNLFVFPPLVAAGGAPTDSFHIASSFCPVSRSLSSGTVMVMVPSKRSADSKLVGNVLDSGWLMV